MRKVVRKQMNDQQRALVVENMDYARKIARKYVRNGVLIEDLEQEAFLAMCYVAMRYDSSKNVSFVTYSTLFVNGCLCKYIMNHCQHSYFNRQQRVFVRMMSLEQMHGEDDGEAMNWEEIIADKPDDEAEERQRAYDMLDFIMGQLTAEEREIMNKYAGLDGEAMSIVDMAREMGVGRKVMSSRIRQIMLKMANNKNEYHERDTEKTF